MQIYKFDPIANADKVGKILPEDLDDSLNGLEGIDERFAALIRMMQVLRCDMTDLCNTARWEGPVIGNLPALTPRTLAFTTEILHGERCEGAWRFVSQLPGVYHVSAYIDVRLMPGITVAVPQLMLHRNGDFWSYLYIEDRTGLNRFRLLGSDYVRLDCGDTLEAVIETGIGSNTLNPGNVLAVYGYIGLSWCGCCGDQTHGTLDTLTLGS